MAAGRLSVLALLAATRPIAGGAHLLMLRTASSPNLGQYAPVTRIACVGPTCQPPSCSKLQMSVPIMQWNRERLSTKQYQGRTRHRALQVRMLDAESEAWMVYAALATSAAAGQHLGASSRIGRALSAPICAMLCTFCAASFGVLPPASESVRAVQGSTVRLATPLLLFSADLRQVASRASRLLPAFVLSVLATLVGAWCGVRLLRAPLALALGVDGLKAAAALAAKNIGGGVNFVAVAAALRLSPTALAISLTADNILALAYFPLCSALGSDLPDPWAGLTPKDAGIKLVNDDLGAQSTQPGEMSTRPKAGAATTATAVPTPAPAPTSAASGGGDCFSQTAALAVASSVVALSLRLSPRGLDIPAATVGMVALASVFPQKLKRLVPAAEQMGTLLLFIFFSTAGWTGGALGVSTLLGGGLPVFAFLLVLYAVHVAILLGVPALMRAVLPRDAVDSLLPRAALLTASNACIGGPATASALAVGNGWPSLVVPSVLVGNLGYAIATFLGILFHRMVLGI